MNLTFIPPKDLRAEYCQHDVVSLTWSKKIINQHDIRLSHVAREIAYYYVPDNGHVKAHKIMCHGCGETLWSAT